MAVKKIYTSVWSAYRSRAKQRNYKWELTRKAFDRMLKLQCHYCGRSPVQVKENKVTANGMIHYYSGIDRVDNLPLYSKTTCVPCCAQCNRMKSYMTKKNFIEHVRRVYGHVVRRRSART